MPQSQQRSIHGRLPLVEMIESRLLLSSVMVSNVSAVEGGAAVFTVSLDAPRAKPLKLNYATRDVTAKAGRNYVPKARSVVIPAGETSALISVKTKRDWVYAPQKKFAIDLVRTKGVEFAKANGVARLANADAAPVVEFLAGNPKVARPAGGLVRNMTFRVRVRGRSEAPVRVTVRTENGTALAGSDYVRTKRVMTFSGQAKVAKAAVTVPIRGSKSAQPNEVFLVRAVNARNATVRTPFSAGTILGKRGLTEGNVASAGPDVAVVSGSTASVRVTLNHLPATPVTVSIATADGSAASGTDYAPVAGTVVFRPGVQEQVIQVPTDAHPAGTPARTFSVQLISATNATIGDAASFATIVSDPAELPVAGPTTAIGEGISFDPTSAWVATGNYKTNLKFNYVLKSTRPTPPAGLRMEVVVAPRDGDISGFGAYRSAPVSGNWDGDGVLRGTIDASGASLPAGATGYWRIYGRLVDAQGLVYGTYPAFIIRAT